MRYRKGYNNQVYDEPEVFKLRFIRPDNDIQTSFCTLTKGGILTVHQFYAWDGASGPTYDSRNVVRGSCGHDCLYECIRRGLLPFTTWKLADKELNHWLKEDGVSAFRRWYWMKGLAFSAGAAARPENERKIYTAP